MSPSGGKPRARGAGKPAAPKAARPATRKPGQAVRPAAPPVVEAGQEREFFGSLFDVTGALVVVLDREGRIVRFNPASERVSGYRFEEVGAVSPGTSWWRRRMRSASASASSACWRANA